MAQPSVDVIVPAKDVGDAIRPALVAVKDQAYPLLGSVVVAAFVRPRWAAAFVRPLRAAAFVQPQLAEVVSVQPQLAGVGSVQPQLAGLVSVQPPLVQARASEPQRSVDQA